MCAGKWVFRSRWFMPGTAPCRTGTE
jgi:hypothetical protein